jgi:hypothetical protein
MPSPSRIALMITAALTCFSLRFVANGDDTRQDTRLFHTARGEPWVFVVDKWWRAMCGRRFERW